MSLEQTRYADALSAQNTIHAIRDMVRSGLLAALSQARSMSLGLPIEVRSTLMDDLSRELHPDGAAGDLLADAFSASIDWAEREVDERGAEAGVGYERPMTPSSPI